MQGTERVVIVGGGVGGLACAVLLAARGLDVTVIERAGSVGGKMRTVSVAGQQIDSGPTVFTMRWVFEEIFAAAGADFGACVKTTPLAILARHARDQHERFDLPADIAAATAAVSAFSGLDEGRRFAAFCADARAIYSTLKTTFLTAQRPGIFGLTQRIGFSQVEALLGLRPFDTLWRALGSYFHDPRLRQLFGRYATYVGSSPFMSPATLMLIAHVEQVGVWSIDGGMQRLAEALMTLATAQGARVILNAEVSEIIVAHGRAAGVALRDGTRIAADAVVVNADPAAVSSGLFGASAQVATPAVNAADRSLSALTWSAVSRTSGFPLLRHNVFFSRDYAAEFADIRRGSLPASPTIYVCAQDRGGRDDETSPGRDNERLLMLVNAPGRGDQGDLDQTEIAACQFQVLAALRRCGLDVTLNAAATEITQPATFHKLFPGTGGALYGRASHGWRASFQRPASHTKIPRLYLAGGATHPGAGVPMAALSGGLAAERLLSDLHSTRRFHPAGTSGGTSTRSVKTPGTP